MTVPLGCGQTQGLARRNVLLAPAAEGRSEARVSHAVSVQRRPIQHPTAGGQPKLHRRRHRCPRSRSRACGLQERRRHRCQHRCHRHHLRRRQGDARPRSRSRASLASALRVDVQQWLAAPPSASRKRSPRRRARSCGWPPTLPLTSNCASTIGSPTPEIRTHSVNPTVGVSTTTCRGNVTDSGQLAPTS